ncbi:aldehyde dehydrogenase family protein [Phenylobacterium sp.]|uniref:aldehyde dehydrogenase family protein n=1 Tax=Phenylobacterium sp. TaxID=1871053 RepID=UPI0025D85693|nr:aldehyde dehydrogenase family protein [Phenylobacterium sp.]
MLRERALDWANQPLGLFIDGSWRPTAERRPCLDPARGEVVAQAAQASAADVDAAVEAARRAFRSGPWREMTRAARAERLRRAAEVIREHAEDLAAIIALENGKTFVEARDDDMPDTAGVLDYYAGWIDKLYGETAPVAAGFLNYIVHEPVGVCGLIVPWNFPLLLAMWKIAPALAMGNTVVVKPSEETPLSLIRCVELWAAAEIFPAGVVNIVTGDGAVGAALSGHPDVDKLSFTGSTATGRKIVQAAGASNLKTVTLELGGKAPVVLFEDTPDVDAAVARCVQVHFSQKGEKCTEPTRLLIQDGLYDRFAAAVVESVQAIRLGDPFDPATTQGAQCGAAQHRKIMGYIEGGRAAGAKLLAGGRAASPPGSPDGFFVEPTVFGEVSKELAIAREEIFGPVLVLQRFASETEAVEMANDTPYGLAAGVYTADLSRAHRVAAALDAGQVFVNRYGCYDFASPFGGFKQSGWGKEMGPHALEAYTRRKSVWVAL